MFVEFLVVVVVDEVSVVLICDFFEGGMDASFAEVDDAFDGSWNEGDDPEFSCEAEDDCFCFGVCVLQDDGKESFDFSGASEGEDIICACVDEDEGITLAAAF